MLAPPIVVTPGGADCTTTSPAGLAESDSLP